MRHRWRTDGRLDGRGGHVTYVARYRALAALRDWRPRATRLEIELVTFGAGPNGGRNRDAEY